MEQLLRPYGLVIDGKLEVGLELVLFDGVVQQIRPHTGIPEPYVVSPAFVNAHSHLEYRGLQDTLTATEYWPWIREIMVAKREQTLEGLAADAELGARENRQTGVAVIAEHSDRPVSGHALKKAGLHGVIFQEVINRSTPDLATQKVDESRERARAQARAGSVPAYVIPHAYQTVDDSTLRWFGASSEPFSMHVAESDLENQMTLSGSGAIADTYRSYGIAYEPSGKRLIPTLHDLGLVSSCAQFVHCCALESDEVALLASQGVKVAHCPRSNVRLSCPPAPIREMLDMGIKVGLGLDSAASSGRIDMFEEMRCALHVSQERHRALTAEEVWSMATSMGADSLRFAIADLSAWQIERGASIPLVRINVAGALTTEDLIVRGEAGLVEWVVTQSQTPLG